MEDGDNLNITFSTKNVSYDKIYLGYKEDTIKNPVITGTKLEEGGYTFTFQVSASDKGKVLPLTVGKLDEPGQIRISGFIFRMKELRVFQLPQMK